jgi:hypothetical protein
MAPKITMDKTKDFFLFSGLMELKNFGKCGEPENKEDLIYPAPGF